MNRVYFCPNCRTKITTDSDNPNGFPFCTRCNIKTRKRPPRLHSGRTEIQLNTRGAALCLLYEMQLAKLPPQPKTNAFFEVVAGMMQHTLLTELHRSANTATHGTSNRNGT